MTAGIGAACVIALVVAGCGAAPPKPTPKEPPLEVQITAGRDTNHGGPLYVVVRKLEQAGFLADDYDAIADKLFVEPRDPSLLRKAIVRPGNVMTVEADRTLADGEILGIYFLFSVPGDAWRLAVLDKKVRRVNVVLGAAGIVSAEQK